MEANKHLVAVALVVGATVACVVGSGGFAVLFLIAACVIEVNA